MYYTKINTAKARQLHSDGEAVYCFPSRLNPLATWDEPERIPNRQNFDIFCQQYKSKKCNSNCGKTICFYKEFAPENPNYNEYFSNNALFVQPKDLPKLGDPRPIGHEGDICVAIELQDTPPQYGAEYLFYKVRYATPGDCFDGMCGTYYFSYAVKRDELVEYLKKGGNVK